MANVGGGGRRKSHKITGVICGQKRKGSRIFVGAKAHCRENANPALNRGAIEQSNRGRPPPASARNKEDPGLIKKKPASPPQG